MKLPLFVYDYVAKRYKVFPYHLLTTLSNGKQGIIVDNRSSENWYAVSLYREHFEKNYQEDLYTCTREYTLKEQR